jgi:hypothetical protein
LTRLEFSPKQPWKHAGTRRKQRAKFLEDDNAEAVGIGIDQPQVWELELTPTGLLMEGDYLIQDVRGRVNEGI